MIFRLFPILLLGFLACQNGEEKNMEKNVKNEVRMMVDSVSKNVSLNGPSAWLNYFDNRPDFFMVSGGQLAFSNYDSARNYINQVLIHSIRSIQLSWDAVRIDSLDNELATFSAAFNEKLIDSGGKSMISRGYFTALARLTSSGWKFANANWSQSQTP